jgi:hypothetical protein
MTSLHEQQEHLIAVISTAFKAASATTHTSVLEVKKCELSSNLIVIVCLCKNVNYYGSNAESTHTYNFGGIQSQFKVATSHAMWLILTFTRLCFSRIT